MKILFLGDVAAKPGLEAVQAYVPDLRKKYGLDCVVANGENVAAGRGITAETAAALFAAGVDVITLGDHTFDQKGVEELLASHPRVIRPANYPAGTVGRGFTTFTTAAGKKVGVLNLQGRVFMRQQIDCPFQFISRWKAEHALGSDYDALVVDFHAEATSEKALAAHLLDGAATLVVGTHTHIPTADTRVQPGGTAFQTDAGMCGDYASSLGMTFESVLPSVVGVGKMRFTPASGPGTLCGVMVEVGQNGLALGVERVRMGHLAA